MAYSLAVAKVINNLDFSKYLLNFFYKYLISKIKVFGMVYIHEKTVEKSFNNGILYGLEVLKNYFSN